MINTELLKPANLFTISLVILTWMIIVKKSGAFVASNQPQQDSED